MIEIDALEFQNALGSLLYFEKFAEHKPKALPKAVGLGKSHNDIMRMLKSLHGNCISLGAPVTASSVRELVSIIEKPGLWQELLAEIKIFKRAVKHEVFGARFFALTSEESSLYTSSVSLFGDAVVKKFPSAVPEIDEAGKC